MSINFNIKTPTISDIPDIINICNEELGKEYLTFQSLKKMITDEKIFIKIALSLNSEIIGFYIGLIASNMEMKKLLHDIPFTDFHPSFNKTETFGVIKTVAIRKDFKKKGIGTTLMKDCLLKFEKREISIISLIAWKSKKGINMERIMATNQFMNLKEIKNYWTSESIQKNYYCPECGAPPCNCSAVVFGKII